MLIAQLEPPHASRGGDWYYRTHSPGEALAEHEGVFVVDATNVHRRRDELLQRAGVLVLNMVTDPDLLPVIAERKRRGAITVYEVNDDVACLQPWNPTAKFYDNPDHQILFRLLIRASDAVQFTTSELQRIYGGLNEQQAVFPNQLARSANDAPRPPAEGRPVVIGWGGSSGHFADIEEIAGPLIDWLEQRDDAVLHLMGSPRIGSLFERLDRRKKRHFATGSIDAYHEFVAGLDIGIAPLLDTGFNRCRSDVKFLEYASHGAVPVVRALAPYQETVEQGGNGFLFETTAELLACLERLVTEPELRAEVGARARDYVASERSERAHSSHRLRFYQSLRGDGACVDPSEWFERLAGIEGVERSGRHLSLGSTRYERLLHDALVLGQRAAQRKKGIKMLRDAMRLQPKAYQPHLFGSALSANPKAWFEGAIERNPASLNARVALAGALGEAGDVQGALGQLLAAAELCPGYDMPYLRLAQLLQGLGQQQEAREFLGAAEAIRGPCIRLVEGGGI